MSEVVVITGATSGVGRAVAREFARHGARVALIARGRPGLEGAAQDVEALGGRALPISVDVADPGQVEEAADRVERELGPIDVWVNDAMTTVFAPFLEIDPDEYRRATDVTYHGTVWGTRAALKRMVPRDRGAVVLVGSAMAYRGIPLQAPYCGAKHAIKGFFESVRSELTHRRSRVRLSMVQLPGLNTPQFDHCRSKMPGHPKPVPPVYQPEVAARAVYAAAHRSRRQIYVGASTLYTIWGNKVAPWLGDLYLGRTAVQSQQMPEPPGAANAEGNLFAPAAGDPGAHGRFDGAAHGRSAVLWASLHRSLVGATAVAAASAIGFGALLGTRRRRVGA